MQDQCFEKLKEQFGLFTDKEGIWRCGGKLNLLPIDCIPASFAQRC